MKKSSDVLRSLPILAVAFGRRHGIEVVIGGNRAYTDYRKIHLPTLPLDASEDLEALAYGYLSHETGHIEFTDPNAKLEAKSDLELSFYRVFEDVRMEAARNARYVGSAQRLSELVVVLAKQGVWGNPQAIASASEGDVIGFGALARLRAGLLGQPIGEYADMWEPRLDKILGTKGRVKFNALLADTADLTCTKDSVLHARKLVTLLEDLANEPEESSEPDDSTDDSNEEEVTGSQGSDQGGSNGSQSPSGDGDHDADVSSGNGQGNTGAAQATQQDREAVKRALASQAGDLRPTDVGDIVANELSQQANQEVAKAGKAGGAGTVSQQLRVNQADDGASQFAEVAAVSQTLRTRLRARMEGISRVRPIRKDWGSRFDPMAAAGFLRGESKLFGHRTNRRKVNTAISLLLDSSGSMSGRITAARQAVLAMAHGFEQIQGVVTAAAAFPEVSVMKEFHEKTGRVERRFDVSAKGGTPMGQAMVWAMSGLAVRKESRKMMVIVTDGEPDDVSGVQLLVRRLKASGVECIGVGIGTESVRRLFPISVVINGVEELATALFGVLGHQLEAA
ncbi:MAG: cobaltochelatase CobT-related protein [Rhodanobacter sp.]